MRILELQFKNLNSLYGEWSIDFTDPEYASSGIFALTGPTGAGKSTILDAICLALYGVTPRLPRINKSGNEIMSRQTGECYSEVVFESQKGRFRCRWEQRRSRKKPDGNLQDQSHEISDDITKKIIESKKSLVGQVIVNKTGMDYERFTRSVLLAQGKFDSFLKAGTEEKSSILEQITGTDIYSKISKQVHNHLSDEKEKLKILEVEGSGIHLLNPEDESQIKLELKDKKENQSKLSKKLSDTNDAKAWIVLIEALNKEIQSLEQKEVGLKKEIEEFQPQRDRLESAKKAALLDREHATLTAARDNYAGLKEKLEEEQSNLPEAQDSVKEQSNILKDSEETTSKAKKVLTEQGPIIKKVRSLDEKIDRQGESIQEQLNAYDEKSIAIEEHKENRQKFQQSCAESEKLYGEAESYLMAHPQDESLISDLGGMEIELDNLGSQQEDIRQKAEELSSASDALADTISSLQSAVEEHDAKDIKLKEIQGVVKANKKELEQLLAGKLIREYEADKEHLQRERELRLTIATMEEHRANLQDGKACPVCGSTEHPFSSGNVPVVSEIDSKIESLTDHVKAIRDQEESIAGFEREQTQIEKEVITLDGVKSSREKDKTVREKEIAKLQDDLDKLSVKFDSSISGISQRLEPLGIDGKSDLDVAKIKEMLRERLNEWKQKISDKEQATSVINEYENKIKTLDSIIENEVKLRSDIELKRDALSKELSAWKTERQEIFGDKNPDTEEARLVEELETAQEAEKSATGQLNDSKIKLSGHEKQIGALNDSIKDEIPKLEKLELSFRGKLEHNNFESEDEYVAATLTGAERDALEKQAEKLDDSYKKIVANIDEKKRVLEVEKNKAITDKSLDETQSNIKELEEEKSEVDGSISTLKYRLDENEKNKSKISEHQESVDAQKRECERWGKLNELIGSSDGKKYRNFAQGITFELMASHANVQLGKMSDRYLLIRDEDEPLTLNVIDNYQAGEMRSTQNLSGGESFIISLALALGLSTMASRNVRVDSLFLDEGFGTLDENSLETALETLSSLQHDGKLIGVISHINALKERITTQISVEPTTGGRSVLRGPGCKRVQRNDS